MGRRPSVRTCGVSPASLAQRGECPGDSPADQSRGIENPSLHDVLLNGLKEQGVSEVRIEEYVMEGARPATNMYQCVELHRGHVQNEELDIYVL